MSPQIEHTDVGAYALGLLEEPDRRAFEVHLAGCRSCAAELAALSGVATGLAGLTPPATEPAAPASPAPAPAADPIGLDGAQVADLVRRRAAVERRRRRARVLLGAAAGIALLAGGAATGAAVAGRDDPAPTPAVTVAAPDGAQALLAGGRRLTATDSGTGTAGVVAVEPKLWGTRVALRLGGVRGPLRCELVAVARTGERHVVTGWSVPPRGYGVPGAPDPLVVQGGTALQPGGIDRFEVRTLDGRTLLSVPNTA
ncbi:hypothetical protein DPM19_00285 [Actinomadura craniellae]|uniref:Putative zinc-finger domain-containing protein n=1 Tax=Actinomadura craniellae TaxID=2231787 RepID=A0A365HEN2_9ACTN|nr:zf-HC2 domain-containing protein [Actinomadura craniellae]RAY16663.1 hypothetical protein DPM19_00285 [Actinomadura craniellae]